MLNNAWRATRYGARTPHTLHLARGVRLAEIEEKLGENFMGKIGWIISLGNFTGDVRWLISVIIFLIFGMFPMIIQVKRIRLFMKRGRITERGKEDALFLINKLRFALFVASIFEIAILIAFLKSSIFQNIFWLPVIITTVIFSNKSSSMVDPVMISLTEETKREDP